MPDRRRLTWTVVALLLVAACGTGTAGRPEQPGPPASAPGDPVDLVGLWTVQDASGEEPGAIHAPLQRLRQERESRLDRAARKLLAQWPDLQRAYLSVESGGITSGTPFAP